MVAQTGYPSDTAEASRIAIEVSVAVTRKVSGESRLQHTDSARPEGLEPPTDRVETGCSIH